MSNDQNTIIAENAYQEGWDAAEKDASLEKAAQIAEKWQRPSQIRTHKEIARDIRALKGRKV